MNELNIILNEFRKDLCNLFESQGFIVEREKSKRKEYDHVFLDDELHEKLKIIEFPNRVNPLAAIQRNKEKIRLRFYYHQLIRYKGLKEALTSPKLKNDGGFSSGFRLKVKKRRCNIQIKLLKDMFS